MRINLQRVGNSRGIRLPKAIIEQCGLEAGIELTVENGRVVLTPANDPRAGWDEQFKAAVNGPEELILGDGGTDFDRDEWTW